MNNNFDFLSYLKGNKLGAYSMLNESNDETLYQIFAKYLKDPDDIEAELKKYKTGGIDAVSDSLAADLTKDEEYSQMDEHSEDRDGEVTAAKNPHVGMQYSKSSNYGDATIDTVEEQKIISRKAQQMIGQQLDGKTIHGWTAEYTQGGSLQWTNPKFPNHIIYATPNWEASNAISVDIYSGDDSDIGFEPQNDPDQYEFYEDEPEKWSTPRAFARSMHTIFKHLENTTVDFHTKDEHFADGDGLYHAAGKEDHVDTFRTDIEEDELSEWGAEDGPSPDDIDDYRRIMDLGGDMIERGIISLLDDGFSNEDIIELVQNILLEFTSANRKRTI
jgi:hypothetical protein